MFRLSEPAEAATSGRTEIQPASHRTQQREAGTEADDGNQIHISRPESLVSPSLAGETSDKTHQLTHNISLKLFHCNSHF